MRAFSLTHLRSLGASATRHLSDLLRLASLYVTGTAAKLNTLATRLAPTSVAPAHHPQPPARHAVTHPAAVQQPQPTVH